VNGFAALDRVDNVFLIGTSNSAYYNGAVSINGFNNLTYVGGSFTIDDNEVLATIDGFNKLAFVGLGLRITSNAKLVPKHNH
jgi:hypothetical protein